MVELKEKANSYAEEKVLEVLKEAFAKVYADGYHDGYKDCSEEIPIDLRDNRTEYVDLGLPSGTLWSKEFEQNGDKVRYLPFCDASNLSLPTEEQWKELLDICKWTKDNSRLYCIGPNGNVLHFAATGYIEAKEEVSLSLSSFFWILSSEDDENIGKAGEIRHSTMYRCTSIMFSGYKLPIRLVKSK